MVEVPTGMVPVTVSEYVPAGVPGFVCPIPPPPPLPPPPQAVSTNISNSSAVSRINARRKDLTSWAQRRAVTQSIVRNIAASMGKLVKRRNVGGIGGKGRERGRPSDGAVVVTVTVTGVAEAPSRADPGETTQVDAAGAPVQAKETVPPLPPRLKLYVAACPRETDAVVVEPEPGARAKSLPVPLSGTVWGLPEPLWVSTSVPCRAPVAVGANVTLILHVAPAAMELGQLLVWAKSPVVAMLCKVSAAWPAVRVMERGGLVELTATELN